MPNWSSNTLIVKADPSNPESVNQLAEFMKKIHAAEKSEHGIFTQFFPCPQDLYDNPGNGFDTWYSWHVANWGTKWDVGYGDINFSESNDSANVQMWFDTAWSPPLVFVKEASLLYPLLSFRCAYSEGGMGFAGYMDFAGGEETGDEFEVENVSWDYPTNEAGEEDEDADPEPSQSWADFMEEYGLHTGG